MDKRDAFIVNKRFNLDGEGVCTLDAIANILDLTRERVRQLEKRALEQLRKAVA
jgi:RNA polymerase primary sigma factor